MLAPGNGNRHPPPEDQRGPVPCQSLKFGVLKASHMLEIKHRNTVLPGRHSDAGWVKAEIWWQQRTKGR